MKILKEFAAIIMAVVIISCHGPASNEAETNTQDATTVKEEGKSYNTSSDTTYTGNSAGIVLQGSKPSNFDWDKKIIKTANVTLDLKNYEVFNKQVHTAIKRYGAYIASEQQNAGDTRIENVVSIKVPVDQFEDLLNSFAGQGVKILEKRISTEDVTAEVIDTKARIEARKQVRERYLDLLKQAKSMKEILAVETEVNSVQETIEAGAGKVQLLAHHAAYSTINLTYFQYLKPEFEPDASPSYVTKLKEAFIEGGTILTGMLLFVVTFWPLILIAFLAWNIVKRRSAKVLKTIKTDSIT